MSWIRPIRVMMMVLLSLTVWLYPGAAAATKLILALGDHSYIRPEAVQAWTGAEVKSDLGEHELVEFAVIVLSNFPFAAMPESVQGGLNEFLLRGGSLLITGGPSAYGSGGYQAIAGFVPFEIRAEQDWRAVPFKPVMPVQPGHPILQEVTFQTVGALNDLNPKAGAIEIARYTGGQTTFGARFPSPLIAEQYVGPGTVLGIAFDLGQEVRSGWPDGSRFVQNVLTYLVGRSPLEPVKPGEEMGVQGR